MSRNVSRAQATRGGKKSRRKSLLWIGIAALVVVVLLVQEQIAVLYLLATLGMAALLSIVAMSDLHYGERPAAPYDDAAAASDGLTDKSRAASWGATSSRAAQRSRER